MSVRTRYVPAMHATDLPKGSRMQPFDAFMLSEQMRQPVRAAGEEIAGIAVTTYIAEAFQTGALAGSVDVKNTVTVINAAPRVSVAVTAHGGIYPRARNPESSTAAIVEFGNSQRPGLHVLARAGAPYDSPKGVL